MCAGIASQKKLDNIGMMAVDVMSIEDMMLVVPEATRDCHPSKAFHKQTGTEHLMDMMGQTGWNDLVAFDDQ